VECLISSGNNNNTAEASTSIQEDLPQQPAISSILLPQQMPQSQQQQGQQQRNQAVSIVPGSSTLAENTFQPNPVQVSIGATVTYLSNILDYESY
jgi:plastocyanin